MEVRNLSIPCLQKVENLKDTCSAMGLRLNSVLRCHSHSVKKLTNVNNYRNATEEEFEVEEVLDIATDENGKEMYLVKWKGWSMKHKSWEPKKNLTGCRSLIKKFHKKRYNMLLNESNANLPMKIKQLKLDSYIRRITKPSAESISALVNQPIKISKKHKSKKLQTSSVKRIKLCQVKETSEPKLLINRFSENLTLKRHQLLQKLKEWEDLINRITGASGLVVVENNVDFEGPPVNFTFINDYKPGEGIIIPDDPLVGCECTDCFESRKTCCAQQCGGHFAYNKYRKLRIPRGSPIYECNKRCKCPPECPNRVVQHGCKVKLAIFRTSNGCGWGVKALEPIKKDSFVMEYVGEVITNEEAELRGKVYDAQGRTYLFDLDYNDGDCPFTVDAASYGNISHFMNHSCEPNLVVYGVWINTLDPRLPRIAFFSTRDIKIGEELTFDYMMTGDTTAQPRNNLSKQQSSSPGKSSYEQKRIQCKCGTLSCRKYLF